MPYCYEYPRPALSVDAIVLRKLPDRVDILLIQRDKPPYEGYWALPGGFVDMNENLPEAAARELVEETGIRGIDLQQLHTFGTPGRDPRGRTVSVVYMGWLKDSDIYGRAGDDARAVAWFPLDELPPLAFDHHEIILMAKKMIKSKNPE